VVSAVAETTPDFAPAMLACPACLSVCRRHSIYLRTIRDIGLDGPVVLSVRVGKYRCATCRTIFKHELPFAGKSKRYSTRAVRKATVAVQEDKTTYTALPNRLNRDFSVQPAKSTGWVWFQEFAGQIDIEEYLRWACSRFSGQISVDSVKDGDMHMWFATDPLNHDLILGYYRAEHANSETLIAFLTTLRDKYGLQPKLFTSDDANVFDNAPNKVWPGVPLQLCHFHVMRTMTYRRLRHSLRAYINRLKPVKPPKNTRPDGTPVPKNSRGYMGDMDYIMKLDAYQKGSELWTELHRKRRLFFKSERNLLKPKSIEHKEAEFLDRFCKLFPELKQFRQLVLDFYALMNCKDLASAQLLRMAFLRRWAKAAKEDENIAYARKQMKDHKWFARLFVFTAFENAHRTTNSTERANRWFRKRQKTHYRNRKEHTIKNMLHADLIYRRERAPTGQPPKQLKRISTPTRKIA